VSCFDRSTDSVDKWLTARLGLPRLLAAALGVSLDVVLSVDTPDTPPQPAIFFGAPTTLALPDRDSARVGVAALILRPGRRTSHLAIAGVHDWPSERDDALRSLERLIQAHAGQWMPTRALWNAPAEVLLPDEVY
jgi:hypothetical protein